jgi:phenazine biosynthesis protein PhzF family
LEYYVVDAFTRDLFGGNPAGVCLIGAPLPEEMMQDIAAENNLPETAFVVPNKDEYDIRWFTPEEEIDLCGHATLASAYILSVSRLRKRTNMFSTARADPSASCDKGISWRWTFPRGLPR